MRLSDSILELKRKTAAAVPAAAIPNSGVKSRKPLYLWTLPLARPRRHPRAASALSACFGILYALGAGAPVTTLTVFSANLIRLAGASSAV